ncbi:MAG: acyl-CoA thioesterase [Bdellovibrio sp. CG10_big_fil_rev_8_21_14_0_10_47_8]|nr:MAG: acyl-CoA thioesterase [Bdellovibrio sp. CG10_big_fil_rev_8_21_14_0_10_47_8]
MYRYIHRVQFYETDLMGIVHHSNYLRFYEEARVAWAHDRGLIDYQKPESAFQLAVIETRVRHLLPAKFGDLCEVDVQARIEGAKVVFEYKMFCMARTKEPISYAKTVHAALDLNLKVIKPPLGLRKILEKETWTETWLSNW